MNIGTSLKTISKNQLCSFIGTGGYVELEENDVLSEGSLVTAVAVLPLLNSGNDKRAGVLPPGYQKMDFLASTSTQYIDTGVAAGDTIGMKIYAQASSNHDGYTSGVHNNYNPIRIVGNINVFGRFNPFSGYWRDHPNVQVPFITSMNFMNEREAWAESEYKKYSFAIDGPYVGSNANLYLFGMNLTTAYWWNGKIFWVKISDGDNIVRDFVPALDLDGTPCMFDTVKKQPFYNKGTGEFRVGIATLQQVRELQLPDNTGNAVRTLYVSLPQEARTDFTAQKHLSDLASLNWSINTQYRDGDVPADYTKVDFLESTGPQYIDLGWYNPATYKGRILFILPDNNASLSGAMCVCGGQTAPYDSADFNWGQSVMQRRGNGAPAIMYNQSGWQPDVVLGELNEVVIDGKNYSWNGQKFLVPEDFVYDSVKMLLFAAGERDYRSAYAVGVKVLRFTWSDESHNYDLIPAINPSGVPGMWDKVNKQFFENAGTGAFVVGIKTLNDARMLNDVLPAVPSGSTYSITLSLPVEASTDAPAQKALQDLAARRWSITVQYREDELPAGYAKVSFLESSGTQYIVTNEPFVGGQTGIRIIGTLALVNGGGWLWGVRPTNSNYLQVGGDTYQMSLAHLPYKALRLSGSGGVKCEAAYNFKADKKMVLFKTEQPSEKLEEEIGANWTYPTTDLPMMIFGMIHIGHVYRPIGHTRIYSFMASQSSEVTCDLIPVINTSGVPGMWDRVNKQFYENSGTGQFRVGLASKEAVRNLYLEPNVPAGTTINLSVPAGTTTEDTNILKANNPNYTFNIRYRS